MIFEAIRGAIPAPVRLPLGRLRRGIAQAYADHLARQAAAKAESDRLETRCGIIANYLAPRAQLAAAWIKSDTESSNFYYDLTDLNKRHLAHWAAAVTGVEVPEIIGYIMELMDDADLLAHLQAGVLASYPQREIRVAYGRRLGWYAVARALKPKVIVETGVDHGVGACVMASALLRNAAQGAPGRYYGLDLNPSAGRLLQPPYASTGQMVYGDAIESLGALPGPVDLFINDSDHSEAYEVGEYDAIRAKLSPGAVVLSDNSHSTTALAAFAEGTGRRFLFFREQPKDHWYQGAGIGAAF